MKVIRYRLGDKVVKGIVVKENLLTVQVKTPDGKIIKRHKTKYNVAPSRMRG